MDVEVFDNTELKNEREEPSVSNSEALFACVWDFFENSFSSAFFGLQSSHITEFSSLKQMISNTLNTPGGDLKNCVLSLFLGAEDRWRCDIN